MPKPAYRRGYLVRRRALLAGPGICHWCGFPLAPGEGEADHLEPVVEAGGTGPLVRSCQHCNRSRGGKLGRARQTTTGTVFGTRPRRRPWIW